jgi:predicted DNA-binding transcriptional regulator AlpA
MFPHEYNPRRMLSTPEAAHYCGSSSSTLSKLRLYGGGPAFLKLGRRVVYHPDDLDAWLASRRRTSTSDEVAA